MCDLTYSRLCGRMMVATLAIDGGFFRLGLHNQIPIAGKAPLFTGRKPFVLLVSQP